MQNLKLKIQSYLVTWWTIMVRPIYFFTLLEDESWQGKSLTFFLVNAWLLAFLAALDVFLLQYVPIGAHLLAGINGFSLLVVFPVVLTLSLAFFTMTFLIAGGAFIVGLFIALWLLAVLLHYIWTFFGGQASLNRMLQSTFYCSAALLIMVPVFLLMLAPKFFGLAPDLFRTGYNFIYFMMAIYAYGLLAVAGRRNYGVARWQAFAGALVPFILLLIFGLIFDKIALSKLQLFIS